MLTEFHGHSSGSPKKKGNLVASLKTAQGMLAPSSLTYPYLQTICILLGSVGYMAWEGLAIFDWV